MAATTNRTLMIVVMFAPAAKANLRKIAKVAEHAADRTTTATPLACCFDTSLPYR
jgi:hypothetical protein